MKQQDKDRIENKAAEYGNKMQPNASKYDAPFYTTLDRLDDIEQSFIAGATYEHERGKWIQGLPDKQGWYMVYDFYKGLTYMDYLFYNATDKCFRDENSNLVQVTHHMSITPPEK